MAKGVGRADDELASDEATSERALPPISSPSSVPRESGARTVSPPSVLHGKFRVLGLQKIFGEEVAYHALHLGTGRRVALHVLCEGASASGIESERMLRAARSAGRAPHLNLLNVVDSGLDPAQRPFVVYEQFAGSGVDQLVAQQGPCALPLAVEIMGQVLDGLSALHTRGVLHRQLRPEHVLVEQGAELRVKLMGLGYAALVQRAHEAPELPRGYSRYLAPEARRREGLAAPALDIYAAGVLMRFLLTGDAGSERELPAELERVVARAMAADSDERFASAEQFRACVRALLGPSTGTSIVPGSLLSDARMMDARLAADEDARVRPVFDIGVVEHYPVLLMIESLYARLGGEGWQALLGELPELEQLLPAAGNGAELRARGVSAELVRAMLSAADRLSGRSRMRFVVELGEELSRRGLSRFRAGLPDDLTPETLVACVPALWCSMVRDGEVALLEQRSDFARLSLRAKARPCASLELSALFAALLRGQLRTLAREGEVNWVAAEALGDGADVFTLAW